MRATLFAQIAAWALVAGTAPALHAQKASDSAAVIIRLGTDTVAVERWVRLADRLETVLVERAPRTNVRRLTAQLDARGQVTQVTIDQQPPRVPPTGAIPTPGGFYAPYALALAQAAQARDTLVTLQLLSGDAPQSFQFRRIGTDAFDLVNSAGATTMRARLNRHGQLLWLDAPPSTTVERVPWLDIDAVARNFAARDQRGQGMGVLSPTDTVRAQAAGANFAVMYSKPGARGRTVFGGLVPYGRVWRTGANDPTQLEISRPVRIGELRLTPGKYILTTIPERDRWHLIVARPAAAANAPAEEVGRAAMPSRATTDYHEHFTILLAPTREGATLHMRWENTEAFIPIVVES
jgi:hypothetical protein